MQIRKAKKNPESSKATPLERIDHQHQRCKFKTDTLELPIILRHFISPSADYFKSTVWDVVFKIKLDEETWSAYDNLPLSITDKNIQKRIVV